MISWPGTPPDLPDPEQWRQRMEAAGLSPAQVEALLGVILGESLRLRHACGRLRLQMFLLTATLGGVQILLMVVIYRLLKSIAEPGG